MYYLKFIIKYRKLKFFIILNFLDYFYQLFFYLFKIIIINFYNVYIYYKIFKIYKNNYLSMFIEILIIQIF